MNEYMKENCKKAGWSVTEGNGQLRFLTDDCIGYEVLAKETDLDTVAMLCSAYTRDMTAAPAAYTRHCKIKDSLTRLAEAIDPWVMSGKKTCPICGSHKFLVTAHVTQDWEVDGDGNFQACTNNCVETTHAPDDEDIWTCAGCGHDGAGAEFNP